MLRWPRFLFFPVLMVFVLAQGFVLVHAKEGEPWRVKDIVSPAEFTAVGVGICALPGERFRIDSQGGEGVLGYAEALSAECHSDGAGLLRLRLLAHEGVGVIRPSDQVISEKTLGSDFPGRNDFLLSGRTRKARHKPLTYLGLIGDTAETLGKNEILVDFATRISYGISDRLNLSTVALASVAYPNFFLKYRVWSHPWSTLSLGTTLVGTAYGEHDRIHLYSGGLSLFYDVKSSTKMISHTVITITTPPEVFRKVTRPGDVLGSLTSSIRTGQQYVFDNWDRLLFGPQYLFETRSVGGYLAYVFVWDRFHLSVNLNVYDITKIKFGVDGYVPHLFGFWRF